MSYPGHSLVVGVLPFCRDAVSTFSSTSRLGNVNGERKAGCILFTGLFVPTDMSTPSLPSLPSPLWPGVVAPDRVQSISRTELNCVLMLKWIASNRTVLTFKRCTYAKVNSLKWSCFCMLNLIVWNRSVFLYLTVRKQKLYLY